MANNAYRELIESVLAFGDLITTRNHEAYSHIFTNSVILDRFPLVTYRKTAWKKAIKEMEWFISGKDQCPESLYDWWNNQLNKDGELLYGYAKQLRRYSDPSDSKLPCPYYGEYDQIKFILNALQTNPHSRRLLLTTWHPGEMSRITCTNDNPNTPTTCHNTVTQFFVRNNHLNLFTYQRSADILLGVPHNWVQTWAMMLYFAYHANLKPGIVRWCFGDAHVYNEPSHIDVANKIINTKLDDTGIELIYDPKEIQYDKNNVPIFKADDFIIDDVIPEPLITIRPKLL